MTEQSGQTVVLIGAAKATLEPADVARSIIFALDQPPNVQIAEMMILPVNGTDFSQPGPGHGKT